MSMLDQEKMLDRRYEFNKKLWDWGLKHLKNGEGDILEFIGFIDRYKYCFVSPNILAEGLNNYDNKETEFRYYNLPTIENAEDDKRKNLDRLLNEIENDGLYWRKYYLDKFVGRWYVRLRNKLNGTYCGTNVDIPDDNYTWFEFASSAIAKIEKQDIGPLSNWEVSSITWCGN